MRQVLCHFSLRFFFLNEVELFTKPLTMQHLVRIKIIAVCASWMFVFVHLNTCARWPQMGTRARAHACHVCTFRVTLRRAGVKMWHLLFSEEQIGSVRFIRHGGRRPGCMELEGEWYDEWPIGGHRSVYTVGLIRCWGPFQSLGWCSVFASEAKKCELLCTLFGEWLIKISERWLQARWENCRTCAT